MRRRTSQLWIREQSSKALHGLALRLRREMWASETSHRQEWLFDQVVMELEWRAARPGRGYLRCVCELCMPPFPHDPWPAAGAGVEEPF